MRGYKAMSRDMICRGYEFKIGGVYEIENDKPLAICDDSGFHFCLGLEDIFDYYNYWDCRVFEVESLSEVITEGNRSVTKGLRINRELSFDELCDYSFNKTQLKDYFNRDFKLFYKFFKQGYYNDNLVAAVNRIANHDLELMYRTFKDYGDEYVHDAVIKRMTDLDLMFDTFKGSPYWFVRRSVVEHMKDYKLMVDTFKDDDSEFVRRSVVERVDDLDLMFEAFKDDKDWLVRRTVVERMNDLDLMVETFKNDPEFYIRQIVVSRMEDSSLIWEIFKDDESWYVRETVSKRMQDLSLMGNTIKDDFDVDVH